VVAADDSVRGYAKAPDNDIDILDRNERKIRYATGTGHIFVFIDFIGVIALKWAPSKGRWRREGDSNPRYSF
jgi:hypothetical protein